MGRAPESSMVLKKIGAICAQESRRLSVHCSREVAKLGMRRQLSASRCL